MRSKHLLKYLVILALLMFAFSAIPAAAQEGDGEGATGETTAPDEGGEEGDAAEGSEGDNAEAAPECDTVVEGDANGDGEADTDGDLDDDGVAECVTEEEGDEGEGEEATPDEGGEETTPDEGGEEATPDEGGEETTAPTEGNTAPTGGDNAAPTGGENAAPTGGENAAPTENRENAATEGQDDLTDENVDNTAPTDDTNNANAEPVDSGEEAPVTIDGGTITEGTAEERQPLAADDVDTSATLPGSFTSQIIAIANLNTTGSSEQAQLTLDQIDGAGTGNVSSSGVFPNGTTFIRDSQLPSNGQFSGILSSGFPAAAAVLTVNSVAKTADAYPGLSSSALGTTLFALGILNKHSNFESRFYCQNAGSNAATITAQFFQTGIATAQATVTSASLPPGAAVKWDIADAAIQNQWPGGAGKFGYAKFTSANTIACVVDTQRTIAPYAQSIFQAVPTTGYASTNAIAPGIFNGHGSSSSNVRGYKFNTGIAIVNPNTQTANVTVLYQATTGYTKSCSASVPGGSMVSWAAAAAGTPGNPFACVGGPLAWPGPTVGTALVTSNVAVMGLINSNKYDTPVGLAAGYSSLVVARTAPTAVTTKAVCPLAFNKNVASDWVSGIQAVNVGTTATNVSFRMVRAGVNPTTAGNSLTLSGGKFNNIAGGAGVSAVLYQDQTQLTNFEGAVFVQSSGQPIAVVSSSTNYNTLGAAALYDCINY
jgi:hypothetical protein